MKKEAFKLLHDMEDSWWYKGRKTVVGDVLSKFIDKKGKEMILDWGAGFGGMFDLLSPYGQVSAFELDSEARSLCQNRGYKNVFSTVDESLSSGNYSMMTLFDVVEHVEDDKELADLLYKNLPVGGYVVATVPAYQWLWSVHDVEHHHFRRYSKKRIKELFIKSGFEIQYCSYWNMTLFFPAALTRLFGFSGSNSLGSSLLDKVFYKIVYIESLLIPFVSLPFGTGIVIIGHKK